MCVSQASMCQPDYVDDGGLLVVTTELFISRVDNTNLGEYGFVPFAEIVEGFDGMAKIHYTQRAVGMRICLSGLVCWSGLLSNQDYRCFSVS